MPITKIDKVLYTGKTHTTGGREGGSSHTADGRLDVKLTTPGAKGDGTNPEQLLAAGWSACFLSAIKLEAGKSKISLPPEFFVDAEIDLGQTGGEYFLQARLNVGLPGVDRATAQQLVDGAHRRCPYSKALHDSIHIETKLV